MSQARCRLSVYGDAVGALDAPIFCAAYRDTPTPSLTLHTTDKINGARWRAAVLRHLEREGVRARCKVKHHSPAALERARSLEAFLRAVPEPKIVFDPTGALFRMRRLVALAQRIRATFGPRILGIYIEAWHRSLYLVFDRAAFAREGGISADALATAKATVEALLAAAAKDGIADAFETVMLGFDQPGIPLVPVDEASPAGEEGLEKTLRKLRRGTVGAALAAMFGTGVAGSAMAQGTQDLPAVSRFNFSLETSAGITDNRFATRTGGTFSVPLGHRFGAQLDVHAGNEGKHARWGVTGYAFWRDPSIALAGIVSTWQTRGDFNFGRTGAQGELYVGDYTVGARIGAQYGQARDGFFGQFEVRWYPIDDLKLAAGGDFAPGSRNMAHFGIEYQPAIQSLPGLALFGDGDVGNQGYYRALFGVRYYFGDVKSLKRRHREDDPMPFNGNESQVLNTPQGPTIVPQSTYVPPTP
jgi:hypothetical protein